MYVYSIMRGTGYACNVCIMHTYVLCVCVIALQTNQINMCRLKYNFNYYTLILNLAQQLHHHIIITTQ